MTGTEGRGASGRCRLSIGPSKQTVGKETLGTSSTVWEERKGSVKSRGLQMCGVQR